MKTYFTLAAMLISWSANAQETLQSVTDRGNVTTNSLQIGGASVNANTTKLFINNPYGKNWAISSGANAIFESGFHIYNWTDYSTAPFFSINDSGNVGIGKHFPEARLDVTGGIMLSSTTNNTAARPAINAVRIQGEINAYSPSGSVYDDGLLRLSAGGGTNSSVKTYIDLSGYSTIPDMDRNIVLGTSGLTYAHCYRRQHRDWYTYSSGKACR